MRTLSLTIVSLFAVAAFANEPAKTAPAAGTTATMTAPAAKTADAKHAEDCTKLTGEAKTKCEAAAKTHKK